MTISAGVAQFDPACGWEGMMRRADGAMYDAKEHGRNSVAARMREDLTRAAI
jgi:PleD family two-component response regulator